VKREKGENSAQKGTKARRRQNNFKKNAGKNRVSCVKFERLDFEQKKLKI
jgi:hypothetical protein